MGHNDDIEFDPYYRWLGIPKGKRPVNHYQLLGISRKEKDQDLIRAAAERQKMVVKSFETDAENEVASRVLYEIEEAQFILLDNDFRQKYNAFLKDKKGKKGWTRGYKNWRKSTLKNSGLPEGYVTSTLNDGFVQEFSIVFGIIFVGFVLMAVISLYLPWNKLLSNPEKNRQKNNIANAQIPPVNKADNQEKKIEDNKNEKEDKKVALKKVVPLANKENPEEIVSEKNSLAVATVFPIDKTVSLFNGVNLEGWKIYIPKKLKATEDECWQVDPERKVLKCLGNDENWIETVSLHRNFNVELEWRIPEGTVVAFPGSGVVVRSSGINKNGKWPRGIEANITNGTSGDFFKVDMKLVTDRPSPDNKRQFLRSATTEKPIGQWNTMGITCNQDRVTVILNGVVVNEGRKVPKINGKICLLSQNTPIEFRNIKLTRINPSEKVDSPKTTSTSVDNTDFVSLFDGETFNGWKTYGSNKVSGWNIQNGQLMTNTQKKIPHLVTDSNYNDFELECEFWMGKKANSGIYLRGRYEVQLLDDSGFPKVEPSGRCGAIYGLIAPDKSVYRGPQKWNDLKVRLEGKTVTVVMNNETIIDKRQISQVTGGQFIDKFDDESGPIAIQHYGDRVRFRNLKIKQLNTN